MLRFPKTRRLFAAAVVSLVVHAAAVGALAWTLAPQLHERLLVVNNTPFAGQQIAVAMSFARPDVHVPPPPEMPPFESPVLITPMEAHLDHHAYVDKQSAEVALEAAALVAADDLADIALPAQPLADRETQIASAEVSATSQPTAAVVKKTRELMPSTAAVAVPPQTVGTSDRKPARMHNNRPPRYPDIARQNRWQGTVLLKLSIDAQGRVTAVEVMTSSGFPVLDAEAVAAVRIWQGEPAMLDGTAVASEEYLPVRFKLQ